MADPKRTSSAGTGEAREKRGRAKPSTGQKASEQKVSKTAGLSKFRFKARKKSGLDVQIDLTGDSSDVVTMRSVRFGAVTVLDIQPDARTIDMNVKAGRDALGRAKKAFVTPGVKLQHRDNIPKFRVDTRSPGILICEIDGRIQRGSIVDGVFVPAD